MHFCKLRKCKIKNSSKSVFSYRFLLNLGSKRDLALQINCENFIMGCTVGVLAILDQRLQSWMGIGVMPFI